MIATVTINEVEFEAKLYIRAEEGGLRVVGARWLAEEGSKFSDSVKLQVVDAERELRESFSNACRDDDPGLYFWAKASHAAFALFTVCEEDALSYIDGAIQADPTSGFFIHDGVVYLSSESKALSERIAADEKRELCALIGLAGVKSKGARL